MRNRAPKSRSRRARTTCARLGGFSAGATESSRSRHTASARLTAALAIMSGREPGTNNVLRALDALRTTYAHLSNQVFPLKAFRPPEAGKRDLDQRASGRRNAPRL